MTAILVLLGLMGLATLASTKSSFSFIAHMVAVPALVGFGIIASPKVLALVTPTTADALVPALRVGAAWLALLVGLRALPPRFDPDWFRRVAFTVVVSAFTWAVCSGAAWVAIETVSSAGWAFTAPASSRVTTVGAAVLVGGVVAGTGFAFSTEALEESGGEASHHLVSFMARHDDVTGVLALLAALWLWPLSPAQAPIYTVPLEPVFVAAGLGLSLAFSHLLVADKDASALTSKIALVGLLTFAAGIASTTVLPAAGIAFFLGGVLAVAGRGQELRDTGLFRTGRPVRLVVLLLVGTWLKLEPAAAAVGVAVALARLIVKIGVKQLLARMGDTRVPLGALLGSSTVSIPLAVSFALSRPAGIGGDEILTAVVVAVSVADICALFVWRHPDLAPTGEAPPDEPPPDGPDAVAGAPVAEVS